MISTPFRVAEPSKVRCPLLRQTGVNGLGFCVFCHTHTRMHNRDRAFIIIITVINNYHHYSRRLEEPTRTNRNSQNSCVDKQNAFSQTFSIVPDNLQKKKFSCDEIDRSIGRHDVTTLVGWFIHSFIHSFQRSFSIIIVVTLVTNTTLPTLVILIKRKRKIK